MNLGIICEFNPLHNGHKYLINSVKEDNNGIICAMSGNFVQRGEFAVFDKFERAKSAIDAGADLVIEIPTLCSTLSAQGFAKAGVDLLEATGICDALAFGAECSDTDELKRVASLIKEKDKFIKQELAKGFSYPKARQNVINSPILEGANNILAIEYISQTKLDFKAIQRIGAGHDSEDASYSSSEIRKHLDSDEISSMKNCEKAVLYKLRTMKEDDFLRIDDVSEGLENRIISAVKEARSLEELYDLIKTKRYTHSRIRRIILRAYLGITNDMPKSPQYLRILAFNEKGRDMLSKMKKSAELPVISKYSDAKSSGEIIQKLFEQESKFTDIYNLGYKIPRQSEEEKTKQIYIKY
ncbi:MAG: nucleotidyltransferase family protein [Eubacterium sp.]|nr:nucleotidyltransferase family protein [Lentisphaeria bacterium]MBQ9530930.1 nucleotidyltransferase family protein [Eubacterium sp.]